MSQLHRITIDPEKCGGRPTLRGLRIRVKDVLDLLAAGASHEEVLEDYPYLEAEDIDAALEFATEQSKYPVLSAIFGRCPVTYFFSTKVRSSIKTAVKFETVC